MVVADDVLLVVGELVTVDVGVVVVVGDVVGVTSNENSNRGWGGRREK